MKEREIKLRELLNELRQLNAEELISLWFQSKTGKDDLYDGLPVLLIETALSALQEFEESIQELEMRAGQ